MVIRLPTMRWVELLIYSAKINTINNFNPPSLFLVNANSHYPIDISCLLLGKPRINLYIVYHTKFLAYCINLQMYSCMYNLLLFSKQIQSINFIIICYLYLHKKPFLYIPLSFLLFVFFSFIFFVFRVRNLNGHLSYRQYEKRSSSNR